MTKEEEEKRTTHAKQWRAIALCFGYNELARKAKLLGEKVYFRFARDQAEVELMKLGGAINLERDPPVLILNEVMPHIQFTEKDIELMRETVKTYDERVQHVKGM